ncbi:hypothetical protein IHE55_10250 [Streptomyces pactum]|uniref:N-acetyltransferase domain-containing protein n=1 Tax=Streptomyces pactum TaxID=68249 RepID=A0ABS0NIZ1_9ACTN|nr:hypothetical protein [Streptomyces pactum]MBH5335157.1 hypothetical protein [Streptomyces pactum]
MDGLVVVDGVDTAARAALLHDVVAELPGCPRLLVVGRRPLRSWAGWTGSGVVTVPLDPLPGHAVDALARAAGITEPETRALVVRLAGGVPLLAAAACRAVHAGASPGTPGAVADRIAEELVQRLAHELPGRRRQHALRLLATVGAADEKLLGGGPELFAALGRLSVVAPAPSGLTLREPYRHVLELAYRWRRPTAHRAAAERAAAYRRELLTEAVTSAEQAELTEQGLFLTGDPELRRALFPPLESAARIGPAREAEADDIGRLMHAWALRGGFATRRALHLTERWVAHGVSSFHVARDREGRPVGLAGLLPISERTADGAEPLLQQYTGAVVDRGDDGALLLGAAYCPDPATHARLLRHILRRAVAARHLVVSTASPDYQALVRTLGFRPHGSLRDDIYRCGRRPEVYSNDFTPAALPWWLRRLGAEPAAGPQEETVADVAWALSRIRDPGALATSRLVGSPATPTVSALQAWLYEAVLELGTAEEQADAEAGAILQSYYLGRAGNHHRVATRLHLSRATYFRRLRRGLEVLATRLASTGRRT